MNLPNKLSLSRIIAIPFFLVCLSSEQLFGIDNDLTNGILRTVALLITIGVTITDWLDGKLAREQQLITNLGKLLDPLADKIFVTSALVALSEIGVVPAWAVILVIGREFLVTGLRSLALESGRVIAADRLGKHKTGWQLGLIITAIVMIGASDYLAAFQVGDPWLGYFNWFAVVAVWIPLAVTLVLTVVSGWNYAAVNRDLLTEKS